jgi:uncharacterized protein (TIGR03083 family)
MDNAKLYDESRQHIVVLAREGDQQAPVDATPGWTVHDVVGHLAGGLGDFVARRFDGVDTGEWGERHVRERRDRSLDDLVAEWEDNRRGADDALASPMGSVLVAEIIAHEHDIRAALNRPGTREGEAVRAAVQRPLAEIDKRIRESGGPALRIVTEDGERVLGDGAPEGTLRVSSFELMRAIGGRRSRDQVRALDWDGDPDRWLDTFFLFGGRDTDLHE